MKVKRLFKKNQIIFSLLAVMIAAAGYLNYIGKDDKKSPELEVGMTDISDSDILAENQAVNSALYSEDEDDEPGTAIFTSGSTVTEFMTEMSLNKEQTRARNKETLMQIIDSDSLSDEQKQNALDMMVQMTGVAELENAAETVLKTKGFQNAMVSITDGMVDVIIGKESITEAEKAQIEDIVKRKTDIPVENITISLMNREDGMAAVSVEEETSVTTSAITEEETAVTTSAVPEEK